MKPTNWSGTVWSQSVSFPQAGRIQVVESKLCACSSTGQSIGLRNRGLGVRVPSGAPLFSLIYGYVAVVRSLKCDKNVINAC